MNIESDGPTEEPKEARVLGVLTGQVLHDPPWPECSDHREQSHREECPPYCRRCGWNRGRTAVAPRQIAKPNGGWGTP